MRIIILAIWTVIALTGTALAQNTDLASIEKSTRHEVLKEAIPPIVTEKYEYYDIYGATAREMRREMSENGIKWDDGKTYDALTTWRVRWDYDYRCTSEGCTAEEFKAKVGITFRYPRWIRPETATDGLAAKWDAYMANLIEHEVGHRDMAVDHAAAMVFAVNELAPAASREDLDIRIRAIVHERMAKLNANAREYDAVTIHGSTQGAVFP